MRLRHDAFVSCLPYSSMVDDNLRPHVWSCASPLASLVFVRFARFRGIVVGLWSVVCRAIWRLEGCWERLIKNYGGKEEGRGIFFIGGWRANENFFGEEKEMDGNGMAVYISSSSKIWGRKFEKVTL